MCFLCLTGARFGFAGFTGGDYLAVIRYGACLHHHRLGGVLFFLTHAGKRRVDGSLIFRRRLYRRLFVAGETRLFFTLKTRLTRFKAHLRFRGTFFFLRDGIDFGFFLTEILHQRNIARTHPGTGAALDAVGKVMRGGFVVLLAFTEPVELLRQQIGRTGVRTGAATDTAFLFLRLAHFSGGRGQQTVSDFYHRHIQPRQGKAHQRAAHDDHLLATGTKTCSIKQMTDRRAQTRPDVARLFYRFTGQRHHAFGQGFAIHHGAFYRIGGADVLHQHADIGGTPAVRHLFAGEDLCQLFRAARRVFGRDNAQRNVVRSCQHRPQHGDRLGFVIFNANQHLARLQNMRKDANAFHHLCRAILHQTVIGGDVRLALGGVNDQRVDFIAAAMQFVAGREARAAKTSDARLMNTLNQRLAAAGAVITPAVALDPLILAVGVNEHAQFRQSRRMRRGVGGNGHHHAGGWRMYRQHTAAPAGQRLTAQYAIACTHAQLTLSADMLLERNDKTRGQRQLTQRRAVGLGLHFRRMNTAVEVPQFIFSESRE